MYDYLESSCKWISTAYADYKDMKYISYDAIQQLLKFGFEIGWSIQCRDCLRSGKVCDFFNQTSQNFKCSKRDDGSDEYRKELILIFSYLIGSSILVIIGAARFICAPLVIFVFLLHKYLSRHKSTVGTK